MKKTKIITKEIEVIDDVLCNKCGKSCRSNDSGDFYGLIEVSFSTGYFSPKLPDGSTYTFSLCEECLDEMFREFKIQPIEESLFGWSVEE